MPENTEELVRKALAKSTPLHRLRELDPALDENQLARLRARVLEARSGRSLSSVSSTALDFERLVGRNIENPIGGVTIPVGVVGPIVVHGSVARGEVYLPLATTEGALVASVNRGASATSKSGGVLVRILRDGMTRAPLFKTNSVDQSLEARGWIEDNFVRLKGAAEETTRHGKLEAVQVFIAGSNMFVRFTFDTGDAMGMNMVTIATQRMCALIEENTHAKLVSLSGNMCTDKKPAHINSLLGRGKSVVAEARIKRDVVEKVLKTTPEEIVDVNMRKNMVGSSLSGSFAQNAHFANVLAASFIALGQDPAQVVECSQGSTFAEVRKDELYFSVTLPTLEVGAVGGGTWLNQQKELISITGALDAKEGLRGKWLAEVIAAGTLCGELSLLGALSSNTLASSHAKLGRSK
jgi:hydroxymethylglutaryl-CoA reductase (NADPH)